MGEMIELCGVLLLKVHFPQNLPTGSVQNKGCGVELEFYMEARHSPQVQNLSIDPGLEQNSY